MLFCIKGNLLFFSIWWSTTLTCRPGRGYGSSRVKNGGRRDFPALRMGMRSLSFHPSHADVKHGVRAGSKSSPELIPSTNEFLLKHHENSLTGFWSYF